MAYIPILPYIKCIALFSYMKYTWRYYSTRIANKNGKVLKTEMPSRNRFLMKFFKNHVKIVYS